METKRKKGAPPRYDETFKAGAIRMVTDQGRPSTEVAKELGICIDTLRSWLKAAGVQAGQVDRQNWDSRRIRELEAEVRALCKQVAEKDEVIDVLKNPLAYFRNHRGEISVRQGQPLGDICEESMPLAENFPQRVLRLAHTGSEPTDKTQPGADAGTGATAQEIARTGPGQPVPHILKPEYSCSLGKVHG